MKKSFKSNDCFDIHSVLGCMVPWLTQEDDQCKGHVPRLPQHEDLINWLRGMVLSSWGGYQYNSEVCLLPCTLISGIGISESYRF